MLNGGADADTLEGGNDTDTLNGGAGDDRRTGGNGSDLFCFTDATGTDTITDFRRGVDKLDLGGIDANTTTGATGDQGFTFVSGGAFTNVAGQLISGQTNGVNFIAGDVNGDGVADFTIFTGATKLDQTDILVI